MEFAAYLRFVAALLAVLGLIGGLAYVVRKYGPRGALALAGGRGKRIGVVEIAPIDTRRRLVLVRRDQTEHLLLLGGHTDLVIDSAPALPGSAKRPEAAQ